MRAGLRARVLAASAVLALIVTVSFAMVLLGARDVRTSAAAAHDPEEEIAAAYHLDRLVVDLETGQRGFIITGDRRFLEPWRTAIAEIPSQTTLFERLGGDEAGHETRRQEIAALVRAYVFEWSRPVLRTALADLSRAQELVATGEGADRREALRTEIDGYVADERELVAARRAQADSAWERALAAGAAAVAGSLLLILLLTAYLTRWVVVPLRRVSVAAGQLAAGDVSVRVTATGSGEVAELGRAFNAMTDALQESRAALESQNVELELQASELAQQQAAADLERRRLQAVLEQMTGGVVIAEAPSGRIVLTSKQADSILGELLQAASAEEYPISRVRHADGRPYTLEDSFLARALRDGETATGQLLEYRRPDGSAVWIEASAAPIRDDEGLVVAGVATFFDVTERHRADESIRALNAELERRAREIEEQRVELDRFFSLSLEMLCVAGVDGYFKRLNPVFERVLGLTEDELLAEPFLSFVHPDDREATLAEVATLARGIDTVSFENRYRCKDGSYRWILWSSTSIPEEGLIYAAARDVTERKEAEERVRALNEELEAQNLELELSSAELESGQAKLQVLNDELEAQRAELERALEALAADRDRLEALYRLGHRLAAGLEHESFAQLVLDEIADFARAEVGTLYTVDHANGGDVTLEAARGVDDRRLPAELTPGAGLPGRALAERQTLAASHGEAGLRLAVFGEDVAVYHEIHIPLVRGEDVLGLLTLARATDTEFSADELEATGHLARQAALALSNRLALGEAKRLANLNRAVLDATTDAIRLVDGDGATILVNREMERMARGVLEMEDGRALWENLDELADRTSDPDAFRAWLDRIAGDPEAEALDEYRLVDSRRWIQRYTTPVRNAAGDLIGRMFVLRDVTAEREAEELKTQLMATVSHELRTPLTGIMGFAELLTRHEADEDARRRYAETIHQEARRLAALINDFLDLQRIEAGKLSLSTAPFELGALLRKEVELYSAESRAHTIALALPDEPLVVEGEQDRIGQVVSNLLSNAIKYSPDGGRVDMAVRAGAGSVRVSVRDEGIGIPAAQQNRVFTKFFRADSSDTRRIGGTGLGLALARELVEAHGGSIGFDSVEGVGSTFWFELPLGGVVVDAGDRRVLVVEDDGPAAALLSECLAADGFDVEAVPTGEEALGRAAADSPDLVCLDIGLQGDLDGWQVLEALKDDPSTAEIPVIVCTAGRGRGRAAALGAADFLTKPISVTALRRAVGRLMNGHEGATVLVVDDEESVRRLVSASLADEGYEVRYARDGDEALAEIERRRPDAVVLDLAMPRLDGFGVLERLHARADTRHLPVVVLTGRRLSEAERRYFGQRAVSLLEKSSYSDSELRRLVRQAIGLREPG